jgi:toxin ParE1/3/4
VTRRVTIKPKAVADLDGIYRFGVETWGRERANDYIEKIDSLFGLLAEGPEIARERSELIPPVRLHPYKSHLIIFRADAITLDVLRVVHGRSDWREAFAE